MNRSTRTDRRSADTDDGLLSGGNLAQLEELMSQMLQTGRTPDDLLRMLDDAPGGGAELVDGIEALLGMTPQEVLTADYSSAQEAIALTFSYGRKRHALVVLIDHRLGGGVKDCFVTDQPDVIRAHYEDSAAKQEVPLPFYEPAQALAILDEALSRPRCPEQPDQVDDVRDHLDLLRSRMELLRDGPTGPREPVHPSVHRLKVTLAGIRPPVWRRIEVPSEATLEQLHQHIQHAFGWYGYHLWVFSTALGEFGPPDPELGHRSASSKTLADVARVRGDRIDYTYDFGDDWMHRIVVEGVCPADPDVAYPRCLTGRRATPPEDCGGVWGYTELLDSLADPDHPQHAENLDWLGLESAEEFDPARFELSAVNEALSQRR